jgi:hypothetical protein
LWERARAERYNSATLLVFFASERVANNETCAAE